jgi:hypothetical protein
MALSSSQARDATHWHSCEAAIADWIVVMATTSTESLAGVGEAQETLATCGREAGGRLTVEACQQEFPSPRQGRGCHAHRVPREAKPGSTSSGSGGLDGCGGVGGAVARCCVGEGSISEEGKESRLGVGR